VSLSRKGGDGGRPWGQSRRDIPCLLSVKVGCDRFPESSLRMSLYLWTSAGWNRLRRPELNKKGEVPESR